MREITDAEIEAAYKVGVPKAKLGGRGKRVDETRDVYAAAVERTREIYANYDHVYVSFSGGKDSTCVLNVAADAAAAEGRLPLQVLFWDEEAVPFSTEDYARRVLARPDVDLSWYCLPVTHRNACSVEHPHWSPWAPEDEPLWCRPMPPEGIHELHPACPDWWTFANEPEKRPSIPVCNSLMAARTDGTVAVLVGNRADESLRRRSIILRRAGVDAHITHQKEYGAKNLWLVYPIYDWGTKDVWTSIGRNQWDYCEFYDLMEMLGVPHTQQRLGPPFGEEPLGRLWTYREIDPQLWEKLSRRVPGANTAAMYSRTVLYGYGDGDEGGAQLPPGKTWEEAITDAIRGHDPRTRTWVAQWVGQFISLHYRKTTDPILDVPHPVTAVSWPWLYKMAVRGDMKKRREPPYTADKAIFRRRYLAYHEALELHRQEQPDAASRPA